jgi:hypothetical protein
MTQRQTGGGYESHYGPGNNDQPASGPIGPQPKRAQPMALNSQVAVDNPDDAETQAQRNAVIERP